MFYDEAQIYVKSGDGGDGCVSFRREKYVPRGGPDGGDGGRGGDVVIRAVPNCKTLMDQIRKRQYIANNGANGRGRLCSGKAGGNLIVKVPPGTLVKDEAGKLLADLKVENQEIVVAEGGKGGRGNAHFASSTNQVPRFAESGIKGQERQLFLELKLIADAGLVGFPNAGKSTLLTRISAAKPKIASYPFTTLEPHLGIVELSGYRRLVIADIPGILEGAHQGVGLGHKFLRHIERTGILIYLIDISPLDATDPFDALQTLQCEISTYSEKLAQKPFLVVANKMDLSDAKEHMAKLSAALPIPVYPISAVTGQGIPQLLEAIASVVQK